MVEQQLSASAFADRATQASPQAPEEGLGHSVSVTSAGFTPGPWRVRPPENEANLWAIEHGAQRLGDICYITLNGEQLRANAHLIAAGPALYEAASRALNFISNTEGEIGETLESGDMLRAALAKARGEA